MPTKIATIGTDHPSSEGHISAPPSPVASEGPNPLNRSVSSSSIPSVAGTTKPRRPSRKSTLTQQQKNQRRQRATQDQLYTLEMEFNKNPTPSAAVRERIADDISMTERSVQIWFQNRRAKIKMIAKKGIESGEDCDAIPESMRQYLALNFDPTTVGARSLINKATGQTTQSLGDTLSGKTTIIHFTCETLCIGAWRRFGQNFMDLVIFCSPDKACMTYYIHNDSAGYKIEYPFSSIRNIVLEMPDDTASSDGAPKQEGLMIELSQPPTFYIDCSNSGGFALCQDFTEDQQGSNCLFHFLCGNAKTLSSQLAKLVALDSFQNRHRIPPFVPFTPPVITPVPDAGPFSDYVHRPVSQPNNRAGMGRSNSMRQNYLGADLNQPRRQHKRQRSRSVPVIVDHTALMEDEPTASVNQAGQRFGHPFIARAAPRRLTHHNAGIPFDGTQFSPVASPPMPHLQINTSLPPTLSSGNSATPGAYPFSAQSSAFPPLSASTAFSGEFPTAPDFFSNPASAFGTGFEAAPPAPGFEHIVAPSINTDPQQHQQHHHSQQPTLLDQQHGPTPPNELSSSICDTRSTAPDVPISVHSGSSPDAKIGLGQATATGASFVGDGAFVLRELNDMYAKQKLDSAAGSVAASPPQSTYTDQSNVCPFPGQNMDTSVTTGAEDSYGMSSFPAFVDTDPMSPGFDEFPVSSGFPFLSSSGMHSQF